MQKNQPSAELEDVATIMREVLHDCVLPHFRNLSAGDVRSKGPGDFVTVADTSAERQLTAKLQAMFPSHRIGGEEGASDDPALMPRVLAAEKFIIMDPLDGTKLYKNGQPRWGMMITKGENGAATGSWILEVTETEGHLDHRLVMGDSSGVWHAPGETEAFAPVPAFRDRTPAKGKPVALFDSNNFAPGILRPDLPARMAGADTMFAWNRDLHSAVSLYNSVILGDATALLAAASKPWDHSAGAFLIQQLGGVSRHLSDDTDYLPAKSKTGVASAMSAQVLELALNDALLPLDQRMGIDPDPRNHPDLLVPGHARSGGSTFTAKPF